MPRRFRGVLPLLLLPVIAVPSQAATGGACRGAAARDAAHPCDASAQRYRAIPAPDLAPILPNSACTPVPSRRPPRTCWFGPPARSATASVALIGDSHAPAWRAAVAVAARAERWHGVTIRRNSCPFSFVHRRAAGARSRACATWVDQALDWLRRHPQVRTVFVAGSASYRITPVDGGDQWQAAVDGAAGALAALPPSVTRVVVLRDSPRASVGTLGCVADALARHRRPDLRCALPRDAALPPDPAVAAASLAGTRVGVIDLTDLMCDHTRCYTVVGGVLVHKDESHLTATFSASLGPYLLSEYGRLTATFPDQTGS